MTDSSRRAQEWLAVHDAELRGEAETPSAIAVRTIGPVLLVDMPGGRRMVTGGDPADAVLPLEELVRTVMDHFLADRGTERIEWKTRAHDRAMAGGLHDLLVAAGFRPGEPETIMMGPVEALGAAGDVPADISLRTVESEEDVRRLEQQAAAAFGEPFEESFVEALLRLRRVDPSVELWVAEAGPDNTVVASGRLEPVRDSQVAGLWGGSVDPAWRGRGIYRALVAARARSAAEAGYRLMISESTPMSEPILARLGLLRVGTTTPYRWTRAEA